MSHGTYGNQHAGELQPRGDGTLGFVGFRARDGCIESLRAVHAAYMTGLLVHEENWLVDVHLMACRRCENHWDALTSHWDDAWLYDGDEESNDRATTPFSDRASSVVGQGLRQSALASTPAQRQYEAIAEAIAQLPSEDHRILDTFMLSRSLCEAARAVALPESMFRLKVHKVVTQIQREVGI